MTIATASGPVTVLHRLAIGVVCLDPFLNPQLNGGVRSPVRAGWERATAGGHRFDDPGWPCVTLEAAGHGRFKLRHPGALPTDLVLRIDDPARRYVPRRFLLHPWPASAIEGDATPYVPVGSRVLRAWMWPGAAYPRPRGTTVVRGRVTHDSEPVRWARLVATGPNQLVAGRAHGDERGEFVLVVTNPDQRPVESTVDIDVRVRAPRVPGPVDTRDRCADLVVQDVPRSSVPPTSGDLDNPVIRGTSVPPGHVSNVHSPRHLTVPVGAELTLTEDIVFDPQP
jgi:hypothetical protein